MFDLIRPRTVLDVAVVGPDLVRLRIERRHDRVVAGRHIAVGLPDGETRAYSICSAESDPFLEILVKRVETGRVSVQLTSLRVNDQVRVEAPRGRFTLASAAPHDRILLLATGSGIAPFRSFWKSYPDWNWTLVHGAREAEADLGAEFASPERRVFCVSGARVPSTAFSGRITAWIAARNRLEFDRVYLCGNTKMIVEAIPMLVDRGIDQEHIFTETYF